MLASTGLFAAVVNRNSGKDLAQCVAGLRDFLSKDRIVVVDCASTDTSVQRIADSGVHIERLGLNAGYAGGNNKALQLIRQFGGRIALIINPDAMIGAHGAALMSELIHDDKSIGAVFPIVYKAEKGRKLEAAYGTINHRHRLVRMIGSKGLDQRKTERFFDVDFGVGCCFCVRISDFFDAGGFDEDFFAYHDEPDLCHRLRHYGRRVVLMPGVSAVHRGIGKNIGRNLAKEYLVARNSVLYMRKNGGFFTRIKFALFLAAGFVYYIPGSLFGKEHFSKRLSGFWDGLLGRPINPKVLKTL